MSRALLALNNYNILGVGGNGLQDNNANCPRWANRGECTKNSNYMLVNCKKSCAGHQGGNTVSATTTTMTTTTTTTTTTSHGKFYNLTILSIGYSQGGR